MEKKINYDAETLIQSQSPLAPFLTIFEQGDELSICYAVNLSDGEVTIVDQIVVDQPLNSNDVMIQWNLSGDRSALIHQESILAVFDFKQSVTHYSTLVPNVNTTWARQTLAFSPDLLMEFSLNDDIKQPHLDRAIKQLKTDDNQLNRIAVYKELLTSKLVVPITTDNSDDPNTLIYTFPNELVEGVDHKGNLICSFSSQGIFTDQVGQHGLTSKKIMADYLCFQANQFDDILGITLTSNDGDSILITREEFRLLSLISKPQRLDTQALLKEFSDVFFEDVFDENRDLVTAFFNKNLRSISLIRSAYYCKAKIGDSKPLFCLVVSSANASERLTAIIDQIKLSELHDFCDFHVFSLSDIMAKTLEQGQTKIY